MCYQQNSDWYKAKGGNIATHPSTLALNARSRSGTSLKLIPSVAYISRGVDINNLRAAMATLRRLIPALKNCATNISHPFQRWKRTQTGVFGTGLCFCLGGAVAYYCYDRTGEFRKLGSVQSFAPLLQTVAAKEKVCQLSVCTLCRILLLLLLSLNPDCMWVQTPAHFNSMYWANVLTW